MLDQKLQQKLLQKLSPQQILLMKLLQVPTLALDQRIKEEIEENPALELEEPETEDDKTEEIEKDEVEPVEDSINDSENEVQEKKEDFEIDEYFDDDETPSYKLSTGNTGSEEEQRDIPYASTVSFQDFLMSQLDVQYFGEREHIIASYIIGNLDDAGYLQRELSAMIDDLAFTQNITTTEDELSGLLKIIQGFDPPGVGARNLQECLIIQLKRKNEDTPAVIAAILILEKYFKEFTKKHYDKIISKADITEQQLKDAIKEILKLNPKPGDSLSETIKTSQYIIPDFIITTNQGELELTLNSKNTPELRLNKTYLNLLENYSQNKRKIDSHQKEAVIFMKQKIDAARWFIDAIKQRQNTLYMTMKAIMDYQKEYFLDGSETKLRPMVLKDIAQMVNMDISTISRVANSKYVQTPFGTFLLKSFFSESLQTDSGEEVSTREVKKILSNLIEAEDKNNPLTDEELTSTLKEKGYNIARRTVAKYREQLNVPVARLRKEL